MMAGLPKSRTSPNSGAISDGAASEMIDVSLFGLTVGMAFMSRVTALCELEGWSSRLRLLRNHHLVERRQLGRCSATVATALGLESFHEAHTSPLVFVRQYAKS